MSDKNKKVLHDECDAYLKHGQKLHPAHVRDMVDKAYKAGYEKAIQNYCIEPNRN